MAWPWLFGHDSSAFEKYSLDNQTLIEGISDDTILLVVFTFSLIGLGIYYSNRERTTSIHPDNREDIEYLRERVHQNVRHDTTNPVPLLVGRPRHDVCPICLVDSSVLSVETNCGHLFCGECIITFWKYQSNWMSGMRCPVCRQTVTVLLTCFTADEETLTNNVINDVQDFNRRFSGAPRSFREYISDIPVLIPHIFRQIFTVQSLTWTYRLRILLVLVLGIGYLLSPLDIIPESVLGILGIIDDLVILLIISLYLVIIYREFLSRR